MKTNFKRGKQFFTPLKRRFMTTNRIMRWILAFALAWVLLRDFWLVNILVKYKPLAVTGTLFRNLSFAYITAFIFYFLNVHLQNYKLKVRTFRYIKNKCVRLQALSINLILSLEESAGAVHIGYQKPPKEYVKNLCAKIHPLQPMKYSELEISFDNYYLLFDFIDLETKKLVKDLLMVKDSLDSEMMMLLTFIEDCAEKDLNYSSGFAFQSHNLEFYSRPIYEYRSLCEDLINCLDKNYEYYQKEYFEFIVEQDREKKK